VGPKCVPPLGDPLLLDAEVGPIDRHQTIVQLVVDETAVEVDLWFCERATTTRGGGENVFGEGTTEKKDSPRGPRDVRESRRPYRLVQ
jgi:hypothetical protein